jgi:hypothetical protein
MIARQQDVGDGADLPLARPDVARVFEQTTLGALRGAHHPRNEPDAGVEDRERGDFAA